MRKSILLDKRVGLTPLQAIQQFRSRNPEYQQIKLGYAGRLDPMAEGLLLILVGEENKKRKEYEALPKIYESTILLGLTTDTYDTLGIMTHAFGQKWPPQIKEKIIDRLPAYLGKTSQPYPHYSSKPVQGKPLYYWARKNKLSEINIPTKEIEIYDIRILSYSELPANELKEYMMTTIPSVKGDFRQEVILKTWHTFFQKSTHLSFPCIKLRISCSSGTYIRSLAHTLGDQLSIGGLALHIKRISIGNYTLRQASKLMLQ